MMLVQEDWLTRQEAARRAGVHYNVIRDWERKGLIDVKRSGPAQNAEVLVSLASLDKHLATRHTASKLSEGETREKLAAVEAENRELRSRLSQSETERREQQERINQLLERVLRLAEHGR
jgi:DNA-binding transcriptional MerR regulator